MKRRNLRQQPRISYAETEEPDLDEYVFCDQCCDFVFEYCAIHGPLLVVPDDKVTAKSPYYGMVPRAAMTIPHVFLHLAPSTVPGAGIGVFSTLTLPRGVRFGPYRGQRAAEVTTHYCWQIMDHKTKKTHVVDAADADKSNWMRYVNCARHWCEQNLVAYQYQGQIYYRTIKIIPKFTELMVFYGSEFAHALRVDLKHYNAPAGYAQKFGAPVKKKMQKESVKEHQENESRKEKNTGAPMKKKTQKESVKENQKNESREDKNTGAPVKKKAQKESAKENQENEAREDKITHKNVSTPETKNNDEKSNSNKNCTITTKGIRKRQSEKKLENHIPKKILKNNNSDIKSNKNVRLSKKNDEVKNPFQSSKKSNCNVKLKTKNKGFKVPTKTTVKSTANLDSNDSDVLHVQPSISENTTKTKEHDQPYTNEKTVNSIQFDGKFLKKGNSKINKNVSNSSQNTKKNQISKNTDNNNNITQKEKFTCNECGKEFYLKNLLIDHIKIHSTKAVNADVYFNCTECNYKSVTRNALERHMKLHDNSRRFQCDTCGYRYQSKYELRQHQRKHLVTKQAVAQSCDICDYKTSNEMYLEEHLKLHAGKKAFCSKCNFTCTEMEEWTQHLGTHIDRGSQIRTLSNEQIYACNVCGKRFTQQKSLRIHSRLHTCEKPYSCGVCGRCFTQIGNLQKHTRIHTGEKPYACDVCGRRFTHSGDLQKHTRIHTGVKPYSCNVCGKCFSDSSTLRNHSRIHTNQKPYSCDVCGRCFTQIGNLQTHTRIHTGEKPYACNVCKKSFSVSSALRRHSRLHTDEKP